MSSNLNIEYPINLHKIQIFLGAMFNHHRSKVVIKGFASIDEGPRIFKEWISNFIAKLDFYF